MSERLELHEILCEIVNIEESDGDRHVYHNPPASVKMKYPAIRYSLKDIKKLRANNATYKNMRCYEVVVIDPKPDSPIAEKVLDLQYCEFDRQYKANNLNHDVFTLYY